MIEMNHSGAWDGVLRILRDPIFALVLSVFLAFLGTRPMRRLARTVFWLAAVVILIWLAAHNASSAHVEIAVVAAVTRVLLVFIAVLFVGALVALAVLLIMYLKTPPASSSLGGGPALRARTSLIGRESSWLDPSEPHESLPGGSASSDVSRLILEEGGRFADYLDRMGHLLEGLFGSVDSDNPVRACAEVMRIYFSGLSGRSVEIGRINEQCNKSIERLANAPAIRSYDIRLPLRNMGSKNWFPAADEWAAVIANADLRLPYLALRVICLKADWRAVAMIMYKSYACMAVLTQLDELLADRRAGPCRTNRPSSPASKVEAEPGHGTLRRQQGLLVPDWNH